METLCLYERQGKMTHRFSDSKFTIPLLVLDTLGKESSKNIVRQEGHDGPE